MLSRARVEETWDSIRGRVRRTPVVAVDLADFGLPPGLLLLKIECLQHSGSFKARGAFANLLLRQVPAAGVVAASGGNHGAAVAYAARALGVPAKVFVPTVSSAAKQARLAAYGADLVVIGDSYSDAWDASQEWAASSGAMTVHAFDQDETILGAGTLGLELEDQVAEVSVAAASVGGGGLLAGIALALSGTVRIVGVEPEGAPTLTWALAAGAPVDAPVGSVAVDSLAPRRLGTRNHEVLAAAGVEVVLVTDEDIASARFLLWDRLRVLAEPGGVAALAAVLSGRLTFGREEVPAVVISGANTDQMPPV